MLKPSIILLIATKIQFVNGLFSFYHRWRAPWFTSRDPPTENGARGEVTITESMVDKTS